LNEQIKERTSSSQITLSVFECLLNHPNWTRAHACLSVCTGKTLTLIWPQTTSSQRTAPD